MNSDALDYLCRAASVFLLTTSVCMGVLTVLIVIINYPPKK